jgi:signal peptidase I
MGHDIALRYGERRVNAPWALRPAPHHGPATSSPAAVVRDVGYLAVHALAVSALTVVIAALAFAVLPQVRGYRSVVVESGSMQPALRVGDVVVLDPDRPVAIGAVIDYETPEGSRLHRVVEIAEDETGYRTRGDANPSADTDLVAPDAVNGSGVWVVPYAGVVRQWFSEARWVPLGAFIAAVTACAMFSRQRWLFAGAPRRNR